MSKYQLEICVVGGDSEDERNIYDGDSREEMEQAMRQHDIEVTSDLDKYFSLCTWDANYCFNDYEDYEYNWEYRV